MPIEILEGDVYKFEPEFLRQIPIVEKAMLSRNLDPSSFTIAKNSPRSRARYGITPQCYDYTITISGESLTVTYPGDQSFFEFFLAQCTANDISYDFSKYADRCRSRKKPQRRHRD
jgi:hypothetical protein